VPDNNLVEAWRPVEGFPGYDVSNQGRVRSSWRRGRPPGSSPVHTMALKISRGYARVGLMRNGKVEMQSVHRLVLTAFVGPCPQGCEACHGNGNRLDNRLENLRWGTRVENMSDRDRHGRTAHQKGERHGCSKLTEKDVAEIIRLCQSGRSRTAVARDFGVSQSHVSSIVLGKRWGHVPVQALATALDVSTEVFRDPES
jgi:hypothetical protein